MKTKLFSFRLFISLFLFFSIISTIPLFSKDITMERERVAILEFTAFNCQDSMGNAITDIIGAKIFNTHIFTLVERTQITQVFKELELQQTGCTDSECAIEVGKLLSANKIIVGMIHKIDKYIIVIKIINIANGKIEGSYKAEAAKESNLDDAVTLIVEKIIFDFRSEEYFSYSLSPCYIMTAGDFSDLADWGYGINTNFSINNLFFHHSVLTLSLGFYSFEGADESIDFITMIPSALYFGYSYSMFMNISISPYIGFGYLLNMMNFDKNGVDQFGNYKYSRKLYHDPLISARCDIDYRLSPFFHIFISPVYTVFIEKERTGQLFGSNFGIKIFY